MATTAAATQELPLHPRSDNGDDTLDIVKTYHRLLDEDSDLSMPMAAIEALIEVLGQSQVKTVFETIDLVKKQSDKLEAAIENHIALSHGTWLFQKYLYSALKSPNPDTTKSAASSSSYEDFEVVRQHLLHNGHIFIKRAKRSRLAIATRGRKLIKDGQTILTFGGSRVVGTLLSLAAGKLEEAEHEDAARHFKVIYAVSPALEAQSNKVIAALRAQQIPVSTISPTEIWYAMPKVDMVIVGAEAVTAPGGMISAMGTSQLAALAKAAKTPFYVAAEQLKFGRTFPLDQFDLPFKQNVIEFSASDDQASKTRQEPVKKHLVDYTEPDYIDAYISDHRVLTPDQVAKEVIDMLL